MAGQTKVSPSLEALLNRPLDERIRENRYRFGQSMVFGLPVLALQWFGPALGGPESARWVGMLQALLSGWIIYVAAAGMLFEGIVRLLFVQRTLSLFVAGAAVLCWLVGLFSWLHSLLFGAYWPIAPLFHVSVIIMILSTAGLWFHLSRLADSQPPPLSPSALPAPKAPFKDENRAGAK